MCSPHAATALDEPAPPQKRRSLSRCRYFLRATHVRLFMLPRKMLGECCRLSTESSQLADSLTEPPELNGPRRPVGKGRGQGPRLGSLIAQPTTGAARSHARA